MLILFVEDQKDGLTQTELIDCLSKHEPDGQVPQGLRKIYGDFGYRYTLSRTFKEVMAILIQQNWVQKKKNAKYHLTLAGITELKLRIQANRKDCYQIAAYGDVDGGELLARLENSS